MSSHPVPPAEPPPKAVDPVTALAAEVQSLREENARLKAQQTASSDTASDQAAMLRSALEELSALRRENKHIIESIAALPSLLEKLDKRLTDAPHGGLPAIADGVSGIPGTEGPGVGGAGAGAGAGAGFGGGGSAGGVGSGAASGVDAPGGVPPPEKTFGTLRLWTGSWNLGAKDPFAGVNIETNADLVQRKLMSLVPSECDVYVLGVQEAVSDSVFDAFAQFTGCFRLPLYSKLDPAREATDKARVRSRRLGHAMNVDDLSKSEVTEVSSTADMLDRVYGRGDGAILTRKFTGIGVFVSPVVAPYTRLLGVYKHSFGASEGSKGGVGVALGMYDVTMAFVTVHLASKKVALRRQQYMDLVERLGAKLGGRGFQLNEEFHHVVWMGDMNYHCANISASDALAMIRTGRCRELLVDHDELLQEREKNNVFYRYEEPIMSPTLFPTYKRLPFRGRVKMTDPDWVHRVYITEFKEPFYKGGRIVERVPSWTDRILYHSLPAHRGRLQPELLDPENPGTSAHNYRTVNHDLDISDHSPVCCTWDLTICADGLVPEDEEATGGGGGGDDSEDGTGSALMSPAGSVAPVPRSVKAWTMPIVVVLKLTDVQVDYKGQMRMPRAVNMLFPLPFEDSDELPIRAKIVRADTLMTLSAKSETRETVTGVVRTTVSRASKLPDLHMLMKVSMNDNTKAQCSIRLGDAGFRAFSGTQTFKFFETLTSFGVPYLDRNGKHVRASFTVEVTTHLDTAATAAAPIAVSALERERLRDLPSEMTFDGDDMGDVEEPEYTVEEEEMLAAQGLVSPASVGGRSAYSRGPRPRYGGSPAAAAPPPAVGPAGGMSGSPGRPLPRGSPSSRAGAGVAPRRGPGGGVVSHSRAAPRHYHPARQAGTGAAAPPPGRPAASHVKDYREIVVDVSDSDEE